jgi:hypothetical protein
MTRKRIDNNSTEFGLWLREQPEIDSKDGYVATNIDYVWHNYNNHLWMLIEEKRFHCRPRTWQKDVFTLVHALCYLDKNYRGFHVLVFENTSPDDGKMWLDEKLISRDDLIQFLQFNFKAVPRRQDRIGGYLPPYDKGDKHGKDQT